MKILRDKEVYYLEKEEVFYDYKGFSERLSTHTITVSLKKSDKFYFTFMSKNVFMLEKMF